MRTGFHPEVDEAFRFRDAIWKPILMVQTDGLGIRRFHNVEGPLCLDDMAHLDFESDESRTEAKCPICERKYIYRQTISELRSLAFRAYQAKQNRQLEVISLDSPIQPLVDRKEDETHWIEVRLGHRKDGRKIAILYIGDKTRSDKAQIFVDLDSEQLRCDRADANPQELVSLVTAEFLNSKHIIEKK